MGCTPLHYASKEGHLVAIDDLIQLGAKLNPKNNEKQSPLHFAARWVSHNSYKKLYIQIAKSTLLKQCFQNL